MATQKIYAVESSSPKEAQRRVVVKQRGLKGSLILMLPRYSLIGPNEEIVISAGHPQCVSIVSTENKSDLISVVPVFEESGRVALGGFQVNFDVQEIRGADDFKALQYLEQFHYKSFDTSSPDDPDGKRRTSESSGGRKALLICYLKIGNTQVPAGYLEIQMPLLMSKPRHELFANPFKHPQRDVSWETWDQDAMRKYVNLIARVARVVVAPEFRGLGIAKTLIESAKKYAATRWHIGGRRPLFIEISAEMLNYIDFVSSAGFVFISKTEGNLRRVVSDLVQMRRGQKISSGIMTLQQKYLRALEKYCAESGKDFEDVLRRLAEIVDSEDPASSLSPSEWLAFRNVIRFPLPYYLCGLDDYSQDYIERYAAYKKSPAKSRARFRANSASFRLRDLRVTTNYKIPHTRYTRLIMDAFGIKGDVLQQTVFGPISIDASPGNIVFIAGPSGSGKSMLLRAIDPEGIVLGEGLVRTQKGNQKYTVAWLRPLDSDRPIFDYFAEKYSPESTFAALSNVGLSEAFVFLKPFKYLSRGQRYRAMLAELLLRDDPVWLMDEFCSDLDPLSARIVSHNLRRHVMRSGRICIVAAANHSHFIDVLRPTSVVTLSVGAEAKVITFREYKNEFLYKVG